MQKGRCGKVIVEGFTFDAPKSCKKFLKSHDEDMWLLDEEAWLRVYKQSFKPPKKCLYTFIERSIGVQKSDIELSYKGGWEVQG